MTASVLMIIPGHADLAGDVVVARCEFHAGAGGVLADGRTIDLLPWRLARRIRESALRLQLGVTSLHFLFRNQNVRCSLAKVDTHPIAGFEDCKAAIGRSLRRGVENRRRA